MRPDRPLPDPDDELMAPFWDGLRRRQLLVQRCAGCGHVRMPASELCPQCWRRGGEWTEIRPSGTIWSLATYRRAMHPGFADEVPYTVVLVELDHGIRLPGRLCGERPEEVRIGERVVGTFEDLEGAVTVLSWTRAGEA